MKKNCLFTLVAAAILSSASLSFGTTSTYTSVIEGDSPVSFWPLSETSGTLIHDVVGTNNGFATNAGNLTLGAPGILYSNGVPSDTAIAFNPTSGGKGFILTPASGENFATNITDPLTLSVEGWFDVPATFAGSPPEVCMMNCGTSCPQGWQMLINSTDTPSPIPEGEIAESSSWHTLNFGTGTYPNKWTYYIMTYDGTTLKVYTNGVLASSAASSYNPATSFDRGPLFIGAYDANCPATNGGIMPTDYYQGSIENVAFYNHALTAGQILNHYSTGTNSGPSAPFIVTPPTSQTNYLGQTATFTVSASGTAPLSYQWQVEANGVYVNLSAGGQFSGVTNTTLTISSLVATNSTNYEVVVTNSAGSVTSSPVTLTVLNGTPAISTQPASQTNYAGLTATFTVGATGLASLSYQWQVESNGVYANLSAGGQFSGVTNTTLTIGSLTLTNATNYDVVVTNSSGSVTSAAATLTVTNAPTNTSSYEVVVLADSPVSFWPLNETSGTVIHDIVGTNNGTAENTSGLTLGVPGVLFSNGVISDTAIHFNNTSSGYIYVPYSSTMNTPHLTVEAWFNTPMYPVTPNGNMQTMDFGDSSAHGWAWYIENVPGPYLAGWLANNTGAFTGNSVPLKPNQWAYYAMTYDGTTFSTYCNGVLTLAVASTYNQVTSTSDPFYMGAYNSSASGGTPTPSDFYQGSMEFVAVYNYALTVAQITNHYYWGTNFSAGPVTNPPSITTQPASQSNYVGQTATFTVTAGGTAPLSYQWQVEANGVYVTLSAGGQFSGVTNTTLTISGLVATNATNYDVVVTNSVGSVTSAPATLTVLNPTGPSINTQPASQTNYVGQTDTFTVSVSGTPPLSYQWQVEASGVYVNLSAGGQFSGVTSSTLSISSLVLTNATNYDVVVTNAYGSVTSAPATLTVLTNLPYQTVILADNPVSYWPMQETTGPTIHDIVTTNAGPFNGTVQISTDGFTSGASDSEGKNWGIIHKTFTNSTSSVATDGATYLFGGSGGLTGTPGDTAIYFTNLNGQLNNAQIAMGTGGTGAYEAQLDASVFSVEAWLNVPTYPIGWTSNTYQVPVCGFCQGGTSDGWFMALNTDSAGSGAYGKTFFGMGLGTGATFANEGPSAQVFSGKWVYVVQEQNAAGYTVVYTNGTLLLSNAVSYKPLSYHPSGEVPLMIGSMGGYYFGGSAFSGYTRCEFWDGGVSHVAYYNYALPAGRIAVHYQAGNAVVILPPPTPTLSIQPSGTNVSLSWTNGFLQQATNVTGPWTDVLPTNETSPQVIAATNSQLFFRASSQP